MIDERPATCIRRPGPAWFHQHRCTGWPRRLALQPAPKAGTGGRAQRLPPRIERTGAGANVHQARRTGHLLRPGSGGHTGDMRVLVCHRAAKSPASPCFVPDALVGWGITNESKAVMSTKPGRQPEVHGGHYHHTHASYKDGNYDGRTPGSTTRSTAVWPVSAWTISSATRSPSCPTQGFHGIFPDKRDPVDPAINYTTRVFCGGEFASLAQRPASDGSPEQVPLAVHLHWTPRPWKCAGRC